MNFSCLSVSCYTLPYVCRVPATDVREGFITQLTFQPGTNKGFMHSAIPKHRLQYKYSIKYSTLPRSAIMYTAAFVIPASKGCFVKRPVRESDKGLYMYVLFSNSQHHCLQIVDSSSRFKAPKKTCQLLLNDN